MRKANAILFAAANPDRTTRLAFDAECRDIALALRAADLRDSIDFQSRFAVTSTDLLRHLHEVDPVILHFSGHGKPSGLVLHDDGGDDRLLPAAVLRQALSVAGSRVRVVVLNACYSADLANELLAVVDHVIGMTGPILDAAARAFAIALYSALGNGQDLANAVSQGTVAVAATRRSEPHRDIGDSAARDGAYPPRHDVRPGVPRNAYVLDPLVDQPRDAGLERLIHGSVIDDALHERLVQHARRTGQADPMVAALLDALGHKIDPTERYWMYVALGRIGTIAAREGLAAAVETDNLASLGLSEGRKIANH
jgi:hypothetical protein